jgi:hypothetical protein
MRSAEAARLSGVAAETICSNPASAPGAAGSTASAPAAADANRMVNQM